MGSPVFSCLVVVLVALLVPRTGFTQEGAGSASRPPAKPPSAQPPVGQLPATITIGASGFAFNGRSAPETSISSNFSGKATKLTRVSFSFQRGPTQELAPVFRGVLWDTRVRGQLTHPGWRVSFGELITRSGALTGPGIRSNGAALRWEKRALVTETTVGQPATFGQGRGGRLVQSTAGIKTSRGTVTAVVSDLFRSENPSSTLGNLYNTAQTLAEASQLDGTGFEQELQAADVQRMARLLAASNRVRGVGVQSELRLFQNHQVSVSAGNLSLANASDQQVSGASGEARYSFSTRRSSFSGRLRRTPGSVPGINIPGNELAFDGSASLSESIKIGGLSFSRSSWLLGRNVPSLMEGRSANVTYSRGESRVDLRVNHRESASIRKRTTKTTAVDVVAPLPFLTFDASVEVGSVNDGRRISRIEIYSSGLTWKRSESSLSAEASYTDQGFGPQFDANVTGSLNVRAFQLRGGAERSRGGLLGAESSLWAGMELPFRRDLSFLIGVDYSNWEDQMWLWSGAAGTEAMSSPWRGTIAIRRSFTLPASLFGFQSPVAKPTGRPSATLDPIHPATSQ